MSTKANDLAFKFIFRDLLRHKAFGFGQHQDTGPPPTQIANDFRVENSEVINRFQNKQFTP